LQIEFKLSLFEATEKLIEKKLAGKKKIFLLLP